MMTDTLSLSLSPPLPVCTQYTPAVWGHAAAPHLVKAAIIGPYSSQLSSSSLPPPPFAPTANARSLFIFFPLNSPDPFFFFTFSSQFWAQFLPKPLQLLESCSTATDCGPGLYCGNCPSLGKTQPFCIRGQAPIPTSIVTCYFHFMRISCCFFLLSIL